MSTCVLLRLRSNSTGGRTTIGLDDTITEARKFQLGKGHFQILRSSIKKIDLSLLFLLFSKHSIFLNAVSGLQADFPDAALDWQKKAQTRVFA